MSSPAHHPPAQEASRFLNQIVLELFDRTTRPPSQRPPRIGSLFVLEDAGDIERVLNDPITFEKDFGLVSAVGASRFNMNGAAWTNIRAKTQRHYAKAGRPSVAAAYRSIYEEELLKESLSHPDDLEDAILTAALRCFFLALELDTEVQSFIPQFHKLRRMVELLQFRSWVSSKDAAVELERIAIELNGIQQDLWDICQGNSAVLTLLQRFSSTGDQFPLETIFTDFVTNMFAGIETTTASLAWMVDCLSRGKDVQDTLREDLNAGREDRIDGFRDECMRLFSPIPFVVRKLTQPATFGSTRLQAGELVMLSLIALHRDPRYWAWPHEFHAGREEFMDRSKLPEFSFRPFLSGPRACGGRRIADMELQVGLRLLLKHYSFENDGPATGFRYSLAFRPILTDRLIIHRLSGHPHA